MTEDDLKNLPYDLNPIFTNNGGQIIINPGSGAVHDATFEQAAINMQTFVVDSADGCEFEPSGNDYGRGRFAFYVRNPRYKHVYEVQMPGIELAHVRFMGEPGQDPWQFPRLYVDDSSWLWKYAILDDGAWREADEYDEEQK